MFSPVELRAQGTSLVTYILCSLVRSPLSCTWREGVWPNVYRARVARATYSAHQSDAWIKFHDCAGMNRMHINDCARSYEITLGTQWNVKLFAFLIHAHQKYMTSYIPRRHGPYTHLARPLRVCERGLGMRLYFVQN